MKLGTNLGIGIQLGLPCLDIPLAARASMSWVSAPSHQPKTHFQLPVKHL